MLEKVLCLDLPGKSTEFAKETLKRAGVLGNPVSIVEGDAAVRFEPLFFSLCFFFATLSGEPALTEAEREQPPNVTSNPVRRDIPGRK